MSIKKISIIGIITVFVLLLAAAFLAAPAGAATGTAYPVTGGNIYIDNGVLTGYDGEITSVTIPDTVTSIRQYAFQKLYNTENGKIL